MNLLLTRLDTYFTGIVQLSLSLWVANLALVAPLPVLSNYSVARVCYNALMFDNLQFNTSFVSSCQKCTIIIVFVMESRRSCANSPLSSRRFSSVRLFQPIPSERIVPRLIWRPNVTACLNDFSIKLFTVFFLAQRLFFAAPSKVSDDNQQHCNDFAVWVFFYPRIGDLLVYMAVRNG